MKRILFAASLLAMAVPATAQFVTFPPPPPLALPQGGRGPDLREALDANAMIGGESVLTTVEEEGVKLPEQRLDTVGLPPEASAGPKQEAPGTPRKPVKARSPKP